MNTDVSRMTRIELLKAFRTLTYLRAVLYGTNKSKWEGLPITGSIDQIRDALFSKVRSGNQSSNECRDR